METAVTTKTIEKLFPHFKCGDFNLEDKHTLDIQEDIQEDE